MKSIRVLLVDDETEFVSTLGERLSLRGIEADWVTSAEDALKKIGDTQYDLSLIHI